MNNRLNIEKEKLLASISPLVIYIISGILFTLSIISCDILYAADRESRFIWAMITMAISVLEWLTAIIGFYSYIYAFKYDVKKSIIFVAACYFLIIIGIVSFYLATKLMP